MHNCWRGMTWSTQHVNLDVPFQSINRHRWSSIRWRYSNPITGLDRPLGFQKVEASQISRQSAHEGGKVVSPTHRPPLPPRKDSWYSFLLEAESTPGHSATKTIMPLKNSNDTIGNRTHDVPACSAVPQPTAPPCAPWSSIMHISNLWYLITNMITLNAVILQLTVSNSICQKKLFPERFLQNHVRYVCFCLRYQKRDVCLSE
jgi:hypothetical protein